MKATTGRGTLAFTILLLGGGAAVASPFRIMMSLNGSDGANPVGPVIEDKHGNLFGLAGNGGRFNGGTIYELPRHGQPEVLYAFEPLVTPWSPVGGLLIDAKGDVYGTLGLGGGGACGAMFQFSAGRHFHIIHTFQADGNQQDGCNPGAGIIEDLAGNFYGTTLFGGSNGYGTVYKVSLDGSETVLHAFGNQGDGQIPNAALVTDSKGNMYGTTSYGGAGGNGTVFKIAPDGKETVLYAFPAGTDAGGPTGVIRDAKTGDLYGTTGFGGACQLCGYLFRIKPDGTETTVFSFTGVNAESYPDPQAGVIEDASGNLYGTTSSGNKYYAGTVFKLAPDGKYTILHSFSRGFDGNDPGASLIFGSDGLLYGTTVYGGKYDNGVGTVFRVAP
jgi:uncharacterized repeat protein (TIGR03803 family)